MTGNRERRSIILRAKIMTLTVITFSYYQAIALKAHYVVAPRQKCKPVEYGGIPPELWHRVFSFLKDKLDLTSLTVVSKAFAALAQPLLFRHITIRPPCSQHHASCRLTCRIGCVERITERMRFSTQERIAHAVTTIEFSPTINYAKRDSSSTEVAAVADMIIRMLPLFPRLRTFRCAHLILQPHHLCTISRMTNLRSFHATNCHMSDNPYDYTHESPMEEFTMAWRGNTSDLLGVTLSPHSHQRWYSFMYPDHLRTLNLAPLDAFLDQMVAGIADRGVQFHALRSLSLPWMAIQSESFVPLLERAPFLQELRFAVRASHRTIITAHPLPRHVLRNLSVLEAPDHALPFLLESKSLRELSCSAVRDGGSLPTDIIAAFDALPPGTLWKLEELSLDMKCISDELLDCLTRTAPHITTLRVDIRGMAWGPTPGSLGSHTTEVQWDSFHPWTNRCLRTSLPSVEHRGVFPVSSAPEYAGVLVHRETICGSHAPCSSSIKRRRCPCPQASFPVQLPLVERGTLLCREPLYEV